MGAGVLLVLGAVALWARPSADWVIEARITVSPYGERPVTVYDERTLFSGHGEGSPAVTVEVDLGEWAGKTVRLDVQGEVTGRGEGGAPVSHIACAAEVEAPTGVIPLEFAGRDSLGSTEGGLGRPVAAGGWEDGRRFVLTGEGSLWQALYVPEEALLRVRLTPVAGDEMEGSPTSLVAAGGPTAGGRSAETAGAGRPNVFIYAIDALRPDHLGCYGYSRGTSPAIDAFAAEAALYERAHTVATWTQPSVATILSGLYPSVHGAVTQFPHIRLPEWPVLLPEALRGAGYRSAFIGANTLVAEEFGFNQGFDDFTCRATAAGRRPYASCRWVNGRAAEFLAEQDPEEPVFMYLHIMEAHGPYEPMPNHANRFDRGFRSRWEPTESDLAALRASPKAELTEQEVEHFKDRYDACVFEADKGFGQFVELLRETGRFDNSLVILLADHGEGFMEHGTLEHAHNLNREEMQVPLVIHFPGGEFGGARVTQQVSLVDVYPSVLRVAGVEPPEGYPVSDFDLRSAAAGDSGPEDRPVFAQLWLCADGRLDLAAVIDPDGYKLVLDMCAKPESVASEEAVGLWDTVRDPEEQVDLSAKLPARAARDERLIRQWLRGESGWEPPSGESRPQRVGLSAEMRRRLKTLGYLK